MDRITFLGILISGALFIVAFILLISFRRKFIVKWIMASLCFFSFWAILMVLGGNGIWFVLFFDMIGLGALFVFYQIVTLIHYDAGTQWNYVKIAVNVDRINSKKELQDCLDFFLMSNKLLAYSSVLIFIIGLILGLTHIDRVDAAGANIAVALITPLYGMIFLILFNYPLIIRLKRRLLDLSNLD